MRTHADAFGPGALGQLVPGPPALNIIKVSSSWNTFDPVEVTVQLCKNTRALIEICGLPPESNILKPRGNKQEKNMRYIILKYLTAPAESKLL